MLILRLSPLRSGMQGDAYLMRSGASPLLPPDMACSYGIDARLHDGDMHFAMQDLEETKREAAQVVELLDLRQGGLTQTLDGGFPELRNSVWQSEVSVQSAVQVRPQPLLQQPL